MILESEFACVNVEVDTQGNGPRLRIVDQRTGHVGYLDPLELETLSWLSKDDLKPFMDPSATRWKAVDPSFVQEVERLDRAWQAGPDRPREG